MSTLDRRLARLESVLLPKPQLSVCMLREPASDAPAEEWAEYRRQVDEAEARGDFLILLVPMKPCVFHGKLDSDSTANWTVIPRQTGHRFQSKLDSHLS